MFLIYTKLICALQKRHTLSCVTRQKNLTMFMLDYRNTVKSLKSGCTELEIAVDNTT